MYPSPQRDLLAVLYKRMPRGPTRVAWTCLTKRCRREDIREGEERSPALRGRRRTRPSNFLYMILYTGGGHTAGCAVLAFVSFQ